MCERLSHVLARLQACEPVVSWEPVKIAGALHSARAEDCTLCGLPPMDRQDDPPHRGLGFRGVFPIPSPVSTVLRRPFNHSLESPL